MILVSFRFDFIRLVYSQLREDAMLQDTATGRTVAAAVAASKMDQTKSKVSHLVNSQMTPRSDECNQSLYTFILF